MVQWLRICLVLQGMWVPSLLEELYVPHAAQHGQKFFKNLTNRTLSIWYYLYLAPAYLVFALFLFFFFLIFIYLATLGLSFGTRGLPSSLQHAGSFFFPLRHVNSCLVGMRDLVS